MATATLFRDDSLTVHIQVHAKNTVTALDPFGAVGTAQLIKEPLYRLRHDLESSPQTCQASCNLGMDMYLEYLRMKTQVPTPLNRFMYKLDIHESTTQWGYTWGLNS